ncbi:MAG: gliding motility-associated C-terminal domain-containing protein, partial [Flavobacteriia bacterium]|nr:gliding motility-associated C-terminal domain-containing protein [Flavobacteriia bacterium]
YIFIDDVSIIEATNEVEISNVFTPNNDGLNDLWNFSLISSLDKTITILNRWGQIVSSGSLGNFSWDGKDKNGNFCQDGVYFYIAEFSEDNKITGFVQLVR